MPSEKGNMHNAWVKRSTWLPIAIYFASVLKVLDVKLNQMQYGICTKSLAPSKESPPYIH